MHLNKSACEIWSCLVYVQFQPKISNARFPTNPSNVIGLLHKPITWYKIRHAKQHVIHQSDLTVLWLGRSTNLCPCITDIVPCDLLCKEHTATFWFGQLVVNNQPRSHSYFVYDNTKNLNNNTFFVSKKLTSLLAQQDLKAPSKQLSFIYNVGNYIVPYM